MGYIKYYYLINYNLSVLTFFVWCFVLGKNEYNNDMPIVRNNNEFHNSNIGNYRPAFSNIRNICTSTMRSSSDDDSNKSHGSLNPYDSNKQNRNIPDMNLVHYDNEPHLNLPYYENEQHFLQNFQNHIDSSVLPVQQHSSHVAKLQYPQVIFCFHILYFISYWFIFMHAFISVI